MTARVKIAVIAGEESGDLLGSDLIAALRHKTGRDIELVGVGGSHLESLGLRSLFDPDEIALMGLGAVLRKLPRLISLIGKTARFIAREKPDCLIVIDSPDFTHRVARKVRALAPDIPIVKYIAPSVWAWRPERAKAMRAFIDHVLVVLPFEVDVMKELQGPPATYVGHRLLSYPPLLAARKQRGKRKKHGGHKPAVVILPGSRRFEIRRLMPVFGEAVAELRRFVPEFEIILPALPRIEAELRVLARDWPAAPQIVVGEEAKWQALTQGDVALAASGTVSLELALLGIPTVLSYKADWFSRMFIMPKVTVWSAALPNIIADEPIVPEYFNEFVRSGMLARQLARHISDSAAREAQLDGFKRVAKLMRTDKPSGELAADAVWAVLQKNKV
ncbi:MAG: Lipid-A-disaccharide synthase [Candidatus Tokpelaia hoelldobleri]|uniref:Lipid-A-disaccharide synthase n=1 Tax=Candidatus Tokpelaia hoelldobleri TaxID=1902579 RepID=A0A1U9JUD3_9HYPH|nr:MAG: Lipid-A-disaccharide synthase [Candidatus Tokpelaia hoelldoblerii]